MVEQPAVNRLVVGSSPTCRASSMATKPRYRSVDMNPERETLGVLVLPSPGLPGRRRRPWWRCALTPRSVDEQPAANVLAPSLEAISKSSPGTPGEGRVFAG